MDLFTIWIAMVVSSLCPSVRTSQSVHSTCGLYCVNYTQWSCLQKLSYYGAYILHLLPSHSVVSDSLWPRGQYSLPDSSIHNNFPGKNTGVGCYFLLQGIFQIQGSNLHLLCLLQWQILCHWATWEVPSLWRHWEVGGGAWIEGITPNPHIFAPHHLTQAVVTCLLLFPLFLLLKYKLPEGRDLVHHHWWVIKGWRRISALGTKLLAGRLVWWVTGWGRSWGAPWLLRPGGSMWCSGGQGW